MAMVRPILPLLLILVLVLPGKTRFEPPEARAGAGADLVTRGPQTDLPPGAHPEDAVRPPPSPATLDDLLHHVTEIARDRARQPWVPPRASLPPGLADMGYDAYRSIEFRQEEALWRDESPFEIQFFAPGYLFTSPVRMHEVHLEEVRTIPFEDRLFDYSGPAASLRGLSTPEMGFAGFRVHFALNTPDSRDEIVVFLGASYFRLLGPGHTHGLSSRGLAIDTVSDSPEEFPEFREFWLIRPGPDADRMTFLALLDSPSVTGAYRFELEPGTSTTLEVEAHLFAREDIGRLGVAPLTSMFLYGPDGARNFDDLRPRVHDSDGLLMMTHFHEWIWRPLNNGRELQVTQLRDEDPLGFGLAQRARHFSDYLDLEARYHQRPSQWVEVLEGDWGEGGVELVEIPTDSEFHDNIVAYWIPDVPFRAGEDRRFRYRLLTFDDRLDHQILAQVVRTNVGWAALPGEGNPPPRDHRRFIIDFHSPPGRALPNGVSTLPGSGIDVPPVEAVLDASSGRFSDLRVQTLPDGEGWRATFRLEPDGSRPTDLRLFLLQGDRRVSETWSYLWKPDDLR